MQAHGDEGGGQERDGDGRQREFNAADVCDVSDQIRSACAEKSADVIHDTHGGSANRCGENFAGNDSEAAEEASAEKSYDWTKEKQ